MSTIDSTPNCDASNLNGSDKGTGIFGVASSDAAPPLEVKESIFNQVAQLIKIPIVGALIFTVFLWWNNSLHAAVLCNGYDLVGVISAISEQVLCGKAFYQLRCNCAIRCGTRCNKESHWHTMRIHGQMYLGVEPPFVRSIS